MAYVISYFFKYSNFLPFLKKVCSLGQSSKTSLNSDFTFAERNTQEFKDK